MTDPAIKLWGILPAAGAGARFGAEIPKQYLSLNGRPVISWSIQALLSTPLKTLIVALSPKDTHPTHGTLTHGTPTPDGTPTHHGTPTDSWDTHWSALDWDTHPRVEACAGGAQRQQSVLNALATLRSRANDEDWILVHDAARPCVRTDDIAKLIELTIAGGKDGGMLGWPVADSLKRVADSMAVLENVDRHRCWHAATPQLFRFGVLCAALERAEENGVSHTDESAAVMAAGGGVLMVPCAKDNLKITHEPDLALAGFILRQREQSS